MHEVSYGDAGNYWGLAGTFLSICKQNPMLLPGFHLFITVSLCRHKVAKSKTIRESAGKLTGRDLYFFNFFFCVCRIEIGNRYLYIKKKRQLIPLEVLTHKARRSPYPGACSLAWKPSSSTASRSRGSQTCPRLTRPLSSVPNVCICRTPEW